MERGGTHAWIQILDSTLEHIASVLCPVRTAWEFLDQRVGQVDICSKVTCNEYLHRFILKSHHEKLTESFVVTLLISKTGPERREIKHNRALAPILLISRTSSNLTKEIKVRLAKLDINTTPIRRSHRHPFRLLSIKKRTNPLQHLIRSGHRKRQLQRIPLEPILPLGLLPRIQSADENVVVPAVDGPLGDGLVGDFIVEVWLLPEPEEDALCGEVGEGADLAAVEEDDGGGGFEGGDGECGLEALLGAGVCGHDVVCAPVEFALGWPPLRDNVSTCGFSLLLG